MVAGYARMLAWEGPRGRTAKGARTTQLPYMPVWGYMCKEGCGNASWRLSSDATAILPSPEAEYYRTDASDVCASPLFSSQARPQCQARLNQVRGGLERHPAAVCGQHASCRCPLLEDAVLHTCALQLCAGSMMHACCRRTSPEAPAAKGSSLLAVPARLPFALAARCLLSRNCCKAYARFLSCMTPLH